VFCREQLRKQVATTSLATVAFDLNLGNDSLLTALVDSIWLAEIRVRNRYGKAKGSYAGSREASRGS